MKTAHTLIVACFLLMGTITFAQTENDQNLIDDAEKAKLALLEADPGMQSFFDESAGYAIFPNVGKGGLIIGGASGNGVVYENGIAVGMADLKKLNIGLQAGGQAVIQVIFFENEASLSEFKEGNFAFGAEVSAVAVKSGIAYNAKYKDGVAVFALTKGGLMADASVGGQKFGYKPFE